MVTAPLSIVSMATPALSILEVSSNSTHEMLRMRPAPDLVQHGDNIFSDLVLLPMQPREVVHLSFLGHTQVRAAVRFSASCAGRYELPVDRDDFFLRRGSWLLLMTIHAPGRF